MVMVDEDDDYYYYDDDIGKQIMLIISDNG